MLSNPADSRPSKSPTGKVAVKKKRNLEERVDEVNRRLKGVVGRISWAKVTHRRKERRDSCAKWEISEENEVV